MKFQLSLRKRIILTFCLFAAILGTVFATAVYISLDYIDDYLIDTRLKQELSHLGSVSASTNDPLVPTSPYIQVYQGTKTMPSFAKQLVYGISEGLHEKYFDGIEYHIAVQVFSKRTENTASSMSSGGSVWIIKGTSKSCDERRDPKSS